MAFVTAASVLIVRNRSASVQLSPARRHQAPRTRRVARVITSAAEGPAVVRPEAGVSDVNLSGANRDMMQAAYAGDVDKVLEAVKAGADVRAADVSRRTALHFAAGHGLRRLVADLVQKGADVDAQDLQGYTALHFATGYERIDTVKELLQSGADANKTTFDGDGKLPIEIAEELLNNLPTRKILGFQLGQDKRKRLEELVRILEDATEVEDDGVDDDDEHAQLERAARALQGGDDSTTTVVVRKITPTPPETTPSATTTPAVAVDDADVKVTVRVRGETIDR